MENNNKTITVKESSSSISMRDLTKLKKKYSVSTTGNKKDIANGLIRVRGSAMDISDIEKLLPLLNKKNNKIAKKIINGAKNNVIVDYKGLWEPQPKPLNTMSRNELIRRLQKFRDAWQKITKRHMDLNDDRLNDESDDQLRKLLANYYDNQSKNLAATWLRI